MRSAPPTASPPMMNILVGRALYATKGMDTDTRVVVVDDDSDYRQLYKLWLPERWDVLEADDGVAGLERIDETVDAVLLDREMPRMGGARVAAELQDRSVDPAVVMVSGVDPGVDVLDIPVDSYLTKPASRDRLLSVLSTVCSWREHDGQRRNLLALAARKSEIDATTRTIELVESDRYRRAQARLERHGLGAVDTVPES